MQPIRGFGNIRNIFILPKQILCEAWVFALSRYQMLVSLAHLPGTLVEHRPRIDGGAGGWLQAGALVALVREMRLELFSLKAAEKALEGLLKQVADILGKNMAPLLLHECVRTLQHCTQGPAAAKARC